MHRSVDIILRARDFDKNANLFIGSALAFHADMISQPFYQKQSNHALDCGKKKCMYMTRCQNLIIHKPYNFELASKSVQKKESILLKVYDAIIGNTSITSIRDLMYNKMPLTSFARVIVHCNRQTRKPVPLCSNTRHKLIENKNKFTIQQQKEFNEKRLEMKAAIDRLLSISTNNDKILCQNKIELRWTDLDQNNHINQSVYGVCIENTLHLYDKQYNEGKSWIHQIGLIYHSEMTVNPINKTYCLVKFYHDNLIQKQREIIGDISQNNKLCCQFRIIINQKYQNKL
eukprot:255226_1